MGAIDCETFQAKFIYRDRNDIRNIAPDCLYDIKAHANYCMECRKLAETFGLLSELEPRSDGLQKFLDEPAFFGSAVGVKRRMAGRSLFHWCCGQRMFKVVETSEEKVSFGKSLNPDYVACKNCGDWYSPSAIE